MHKILVIDDDQTVCKSLELILKKSDYDVKSISQPALALEVLESFRPHLVILDMNFTIDTSGKQGMLMLKRIIEFDSSIIVILITGWATLQLAVRGMKNGAKDFLAKPWDNKHLLSSIKTLLSLHSESSGSSSAYASKDDHIIGQSESFKQVLKLVERVSNLSLIHI